MRLLMRSRRVQVATILIAGTLLFGVILFFTSRLIGSDDTIFQTQIQPYHSVVDWVLYRYNNWSGRIFAEAFVYIFSPLNIIAWKIVSLMMFAASSVYLYLYYTLFSSTRSHKKDIVMAGLAVLLPYLMQESVISTGALWVTGSMNYFWISSLALIGFYPLAFMLKHGRLPSASITALGIICTIMAASSQEQVGAILCGLSMLSAIYAYLSSRSLQLSHLLYIAVAGASFAVGALAPGNRLRFVAETNTWLPDFNTIPLGDHIQYAYRWFLDATINHTGFLLAATMLILGILLVQKHSKNKLDAILSVVLIASSLIMLTKGLEAMQPFTQFYATWKPQIPQGIAPRLLALAWLIPICATIIAPIRLFREKSHGVSVAVLLAGAYACIAMITLSPTMYASGWRTIFVPSILFMVILYVLSSKLIDIASRSSRYLILVTSVLAACAWFTLIYAAIHHQIGR